MRLSLARYQPRRFLAIAASFVGLWWSLAGAAPSSWWFGLPLVAIATVLATRGAAVAWRISPVAVLRFLPFFLWRALTGGADVARRAFDPRLPLAPAFLTFRLRLTGQAAVLLTGVLNLSPGTLTVELDGDEVMIHVVDKTRPIERQLRAAEDAVARLLGIALPPGDR
jgi:multicomponent Na+:H+ antiporter subunit E